jgi:pentatricopeptide repeat protein
MSEFSHERNFDDFVGIAAEFLTKTDAGRLELDSLVAERLLSAMAFGSNRLGETASQFWDYVCRQGICARGVRVWNIMLFSAKQQGDVVAAERLFAHMVEEGVPRNTVTFSTLITAQGNARNVARAEELFAQMVEEGVPCDGRLPSSGKSFPLGRGDVRISPPPWKRLTLGLQLTVLSDGGSRRGGVRGSSRGGYGRGRDSSSSGQSRGSDRGRGSSLGMGH